MLVKRHRFDAEGNAEGSHSKEALCGVDGGALNMIGAVVLSSYIPGTQEEVVEVAGGEKNVKYFMVGGAVIYQIPISMILVSRYLPRRLWSLGQRGRRHSRCCYSCRRLLRRPPLLLRWRRRASYAFVHRLHGYRVAYRRTSHFLPDTGKGGIKVDLRTCRGREIP